MTIWLVRIALFLLPIAGFLVWLRVTRDQDRAARAVLPALGLTILLSLVLSMLGVLLSRDQTGRPGEIYTAPYVKDGKIVDGGFRPAEPARP